MSRIGRHAHVTVVTALTKVKVSVVTTGKTVPRGISVTGVTNQLARRIPNSRSYRCVMTTRCRTSAEVAAASRDRHASRVRHLRRVKIHRAVDVSRIRLGIVTLRTQRRLILKVLVVSLADRVGRVADRAVAAGRAPHRRLDRRALTVVVACRRRTRVRAEVHRADKVNTTVKVIIVARVINVAARTTDTGNAERTRNRSRKVLIVRVRTRITITVTKSTTRTARLPRRRVRGTGRRVVARSVTARIVPVVPRTHQHTSFVLISCRAVR
jgi:hypothetical protein